jgi:hypothetical protein
LGEADLQVGDVVATQIRPGQVQEAFAELPAGFDESLDQVVASATPVMGSPRALEGLDRERRALAVVARGIDERRVAEVGQPFLKLTYSGPEAPGCRSSKFRVN